MGVRKVIERINNIAVRAFCPATEGVALSCDCEVTAVKGFAVWQGYCFVEVDVDFVTCLSANRALVAV